ncbi:MAG: CRTAC1 family protein [Bryobacterales bacterium]
MYSPALYSADTSARFVDVTAEAGIGFRHVNSATSLKYLIETVSGGVGFLDYDNDGWLDIYCVNGARLSDPQPDGVKLDKTDPKFWNRLYRNNHDGTFSDVTEKSGLRGEGYGMGVAAADYDNDGFTDLLVTSYGGAHLYRNNGDGTFRDVTRQANLLTEGWTTSAAFLDYDNDGRLDLFISRYLRWNFETGARYCGTKTPGGRAYCHPDEFPPIANYLFRNNGDGTFRDVSESSGIAGSEGKALGVAVNDFNGDGFLDISVANDSHAQFLFQNNGGGAFDEVALVAGAAYTEDGETFAGMGTDFADIDNDGLPDILTTALPHQSFAFFHNTGKEMFNYESFRSNLSEITQLYSGWGMRVFDYDNDGVKDVFLANSHVMDNIELTQPNVSYKQKPLLLKFAAGKFADVSSKAGPVFEKAMAARGAAFGDYDNDGDIDVAVMTSDGPLHLLRNDGGNANAWIGLDLRGTRSNRDGLGARVTLTQPGGKKQYAVASSTASYLASNDRRVFFGLGSGGVVEQIQIKWPSGVEQTISKPKAGQILKVEEPQP